MTDEPMPPCPRGCPVTKATITAGRTEGRQILAAPLVELWPCGHRFEGVEAGFYIIPARQWAARAAAQHREIAFLSKPHGGTATAIEASEDVKSEGDHG
jgi:hypothetical protein